MAQKETQQRAAKGLKLTDVLITIVIAAVFGVIYRIWGPMYDLLKPLGLHAEQLSYGMWFMAGTFAFLVIRKPWVALLAELAAATVEALYGGSWGVTTLVYGLLQGLGAELIFAAFRYRRVNVGVTMLAALGSAIFSLFVDNYYGYIEELAFWNFVLFIVTRLIGSAIIAGVFAYYLTSALARTGVLNLVRPVSSKDYDALG
ncbi:ECF transporter S component [Paenibacillus whitsoniae]|uniref:Thiamine ABC transporter permease n=1 Tax=Paenibacillus whitsoniae TaxID=2496558 RepID=A0A430JBN4_9BACL|nr:ECF transporter S component [Paenibacillus whitsoniae]RTE08438.1 thiamine ABC transporter permease [Paenibacillus whitsoniae]